MVRTTTESDDESAKNKGGTDTCGVDGCLNNYTPNRTGDGELRCVTHDPDRHDGE